MADLLSNVEKTTDLEKEVDDLAACLDRVMSRYGCSAGVDVVKGEDMYVAAFTAKSPEGCTRHLICVCMNQVWNRSALLQGLLREFGSQARWSCGDLAGPGKPDVTVPGAFSVEEFRIKAAAEGLL